MSKKPSLSPTRAQILVTVLVVSLNIVFKTLILIQMLSN
jgi:hypothetical protein